jgi:predicted nucleic acid-binding protein
MALAVVDASVVVKWFLEEEYTAPARRLREDFLEGSLRLQVPSLLPFEVLNALRYNPNFPVRALPAASRALDAAGLLTVPLFGEYAERTVAASSRFDLTIYDAAYVALADLADCSLYTGDRELIALAPTRTEIVHIRDYGRNQA